MPHAKLRFVPPPSQAGHILLYVVWVVVLLSVFVTSVGSRVLFALGLSERLSGQLQAAYIARGAVQSAARWLAADQNTAVDTLQERWADHPEAFDSHPLAGGTFTVTAEARPDGAPRYGLDDEEQRIPLNTAPVPVLQALMETVGGLDEDAAQDVAAAIADWRDEDTNERSGGAENYYYQSRAPGYDCKDGPFEHPAELLLVKGVSPELYRRVEPWVTVYGSGRVNLNTAGPSVLGALGLSPAGLAGLSAYRAGEDGLERTTDDRQIDSIVTLESSLSAFVPAEDLVVLVRLITEDFLSVRSEAFRAAVEAHTGRAAGRMSVQSVLDRDGRILSWMER